MNLRRTKWFAILMMLLMTTFLLAEELKPAPTFRLFNQGYGAAALGMGGAFVAIANDLSAIYWNPAGLAQLADFQVLVDYKFEGDSDEDFSEVGVLDTFQSQQRYSLSGNQFEAIAASFAIKRGTMTFVPAFAWQRSSTRTIERQLKDISGFVTFVPDERLTFFQSEGEFREEINGGDDEYVFALSASPNPRVLIGGTWTLLAGGPEENLSGIFHDSFVSPNQVLRTDLTLSQTRKEDISGNYFKFGILAFPAKKMTIGGYVRFPYTRSSDITLDRSGPFTFENTIRNPATGETIRIETGSGTLDERATAQSEIEFPIEIGAGLGLRASKNLLVSGAFAYSEHGDTVLLISNSSDPALLPETTLPFPTLRTGASPQDVLLQWRGGIEYTMGGVQSGILLRSGYFFDAQPYANTEGKAVYFKGYSFGAGVVARSFRFDVAFVSEEGDLVFTVDDKEESRFKNRRWIFSLTLAS